MRYKDVNWSLSAGKKGVDGATIHEGENIIISLLMDIRDELKLSNLALRHLSVLSCTNFLRIPRDLQAVRRNTNHLKELLQPCPKPSKINISIPPYSAKPATPRKKKRR